MSRAQSSASPTSTTVSGLPGTTGTPAAAMSRRAAVLSPTVRIAPDDGPAHTRGARPRPRAAPARTPPAGRAGPPLGRGSPRPRARGGAAGPGEPRLDHTVG